MLNRSGIETLSLGAPTQILANVDMQASVGCIVAQSLGTTQDDGKKIAYAGTPIMIDPSNMQTAAAAPGENQTANAVLLHDVDVTAGAANGMALIFGIVNYDRLNATVKAAVTPGINAYGAVSVIKMQ